jgi:MarR family transcriptional regulator for hemolysin
MTITKDRRTAVRRQGKGEVAEESPQRPFVRTNVAGKLREASDLLVQVMRARVKPFGLSLNQYRLLREVWEDEGVGQRVIAARMHVSEPATANTIDALEAADLVRRVRADGDRRKSLIYLTPKGAGLRDEILAVNADVNAGAIARVDRASVEAFVATLDRVIGNLTALKKYLGS